MKKRSMDNLVLDSSYLLPIFGVKVGYRNFDSIFPELLSKYSVKYSPISLIETKWVMIRDTKNFPQNKSIHFRDFREGLLSIQKTQLFYFIIAYSFSSH